MYFPDIVKDQDGLLAELLKLHLEHGVGANDSPTGMVLFRAAATGDIEKVRETIKSNPEEVIIQFS